MWIRKYMMRNRILSCVLLCFVVGRPVTAIVSKTQAQSKHSPQPKSANSKVDVANSKQDSQPSQSINRDYGYGDNQLGGGYGGSGLGHYGGYEDGYNSYGDSKYHGFDKDEHNHHDHSPTNYHHKALAIKGLLLPLAGVALLGAAAAFVSNPILLQLGVISGTYGRRRRRDTNNNPGLDIDEATARLEAQIRFGEIQLLERFMAQVPKEEIQSQEKKLLANYLSCSGLGAQNACLERLSCELHSTQGTSMPVETHVMSIVANEILNNELVPETTKQRLSRAMELGRTEGNCERYSCEEMEADSRTAA